MGMNEKQEYMKPKISELSSNYTNAGKVSKQADEQIDGGSDKTMGPS